MKNQKLSTKLILAFLGSALFTLLIGMAGIFAEVRLKSLISEIGLVRLPSLTGLSMLGDAMSNLDGMENTLMAMSYSVQQRRELDKEIKEAWKRLDEGWKIYAPLPQTPDEAATWKKFEAAFKAWKGHHQTFMVMAKEFERLQASGAEAAALLAQNDKMTRHMFSNNDVAMDQASDYLKKIVDINQNVAAAFTKRALDDSRLLLTAMIVLSVLGITVSIAIGVIVSEFISNPIRRLATQLKAGAQETTNASNQVSSASHSLAEGASEQAASLEETSSSLEEMASMTKRNAEHAAHAKDLAKDTHTCAEQATSDIATMGSVMEAVAKSSEQLRVAMDKIEASSGQISQIMKTIDEIAFQTNILSLNAAVEAARAGEAGAGFAVVADEVRNLAKRSADAAKQTAQMIKDAADSSHQGKVVTEKVSADLTNMVQASQRVKSGLEAIVQKAREVDSVIAEISTASHEQQQGISQVNFAVSQMDKITQTNASSAEETASAATELNAQAGELQDAIVQLLELVNGAQPPSGVAFGSRAGAAKANPIKAPAMGPKPRGTTARKQPVGLLESSFQDF